MEGGGTSHPTAGAAPATTAHRSASSATSESIVPSVRHLTSPLRFGHFARECREEENLCYKCHKSGHIAKDCSQPDLCYVCNKVNLGK